MIKIRSLFGYLFLGLKLLKHISILEKRKRKNERQRSWRHHQIHCVNLEIKRGFAQQSFQAMV